MIATAICELAEDVMTRSLNVRYWAEPKRLAGIASAWAEQTQVGYGAAVQAAGEIAAQEAADAYTRGAAIWVESECHAAMKAARDSARHAAVARLGVPPYLVDNWLAPYVGQENCQA